MIATVQNRGLAGAPGRGAVPSAELLQRLDVTGPRYTSYPTADRFVDAFGAKDYTLALQHRSVAGTAGALPLSLYVHLPFCESLCYYCACNKIVTKRRDRAEEYLDFLQREIVLQAALLEGAKPVSQLHLGGGTPTFFSDAQLATLMRALRQAFAFTPDAECSIEIDPRTVDAQRLGQLAALGFNRLSFGVQDFDAQVQKAVHRIQPARQVFELVAAARGLGFGSISIDLIYGLPRQSPASFGRTLAQVEALAPDRIALYAYAHLPERFKPQRRIDAAELPNAHDKVQMLADAIAVLARVGYSYIGMDHFALPHDSLAVARRQGRLHRNFQGYSTQPDCDIVALGVSAIGRIGACYSQNAKTLDEYYDLIGQGRLAVTRGLALTHDDLMRRAAIMAIMCQGRLDFEAFDTAWLIDTRRHFVSELSALAPLQAQGLVQVDAQAIQVTALGWYFVRAVAMVFDRYLQADRNRSRFSRII